MANNVIKIKRTSVSGRAANTTTLPNPGELALNMTDGILYSTNGSVVFEVGANNTNARVSNTLTINALSAGGSLGQPGYVLVSNGNGTYWTSFGAASVDVTAQYYWTNTHSFQANISIASALIANGAAGTNGQVLTSDGAKAYWANSTGGGGFPYIDLGFVFEAVTTPDIDLGSLV